MNTGIDGSTAMEPLEREREHGESRSEATDAPDRYEETTIGVVVPAYNEAEHVGAVLDSIPSFVDRIYAVDDASQDDTWSEIRDRATRGGERVADGGEVSEARRTSLERSSNGGETSEARRVSSAFRSDDGRSVDPRIVPIRHSENQGAGAALRTGYQRALADGVEVTVAMDADGQMDPDRMPDLLDPIVEGSADYAKGNRLSDPAYRAAMPPFRQFGNRLLTLLTKVASGYWKTMDPQNGYTAISGEALRRIDLSALPDGHDYTNDLLVRLNVAGLRVADVAMPAVYGEEESSISYSRFVPSTSTTLLRSFLWRLRRRYLGRDFHPLALFYGAGTASTVVGLFLGADALRNRRGDDDGRAGSSALLSVLFGCLFVLWAMVLDVRENEDREVTWE